MLTNQSMTQYALLQYQSDTAFKYFVDENIAKLQPSFNANTTIADLFMCVVNPHGLTLAKYLLDKWEIHNDRRVYSAA